LYKLPGPTLRAIQALELPALPGTLVAFMRAVSQEDASMRAVGELVLREPALAARILHVANSAAFRSAGSLRSIDQSLQVLGVRVLRSVAACLAVQQAFGRMPVLAPEDLSGFWRHALFVAELAQAIAAATGLAEPEEAYLCGLLHDVGQLMLLGGMGSSYGAILVEAGTEPALAALERAALETDHAEVGAWLVDQWQLPSFMADAIRFHHHGLEAIAQADDLTRSVWVAHAAQGLADQATPDADGFAAVARLVQLPAMQLAHLCGTAQANVAQLAAALGVPAAISALPQWRPAPEPAPRHPELRALQEALASMAALQPLQHELAASDSEAHLLSAARESARILFGVGDVVFLLRRGDPPLMCGLPLAGQTALLGRLRVPLEPPARDACARAAVTGTLCSTFSRRPDGAPAVRDQQLARLLGSAGLVCAPMAVGATVWGLMVFPVDAAGAASQHQRETQILAFAGIVAGQLQGWRRLRERNLDKQAAAADDWLLRGRQVAHEVSNPLGTIKTYLQIMQRKLPENVQMNDELQVLREEIDRVARIVRQLGEAPAGQVAPAGTAIDLNAAVEGFGALYSDALFGGGGIELVLTLQRPLAPSQADRDTVRQVLLNLWKNAAEALPPGSRIVTATTDHVYRDGRVYTQLSVSDNGPGLPADVMRTPFQPLGMNRRPGRSGLGLSIVQSLVAGLAGHVSCQTAPGRGTRFEVLFPQGISAQAAAAVGDAA
jgi:putative nucleotidyltransferase with HDIG domain